MKTGAPSPFSTHIPRTGGAPTWSKAPEHREALRESWQRATTGTLTPRMGAYRLLITTLSTEAAPETMAAKALAKSPGFTSLTLVTPAKSATFFGQGVGFAFDLAPAGLVATSPTDFASGGPVDDADQWFRRRGLHTPEALLEATKPQEWNEVLALRPHLKARAVVLFDDATQDEQRYGAELSRASGLPLVTLAR